MMFLEATAVARRPAPELQPPLAGGTRAGAAPHRPVPPVPFPHRLRSTLRRAAGPGAILPRLIKMTREKERE
jgi:hypothetical protein